MPTSDPAVQWLLRSRNPSVRSPYWHYDILEAGPLILAGLGVLVVIGGAAMSTARGKVKAEGEPMFLEELQRRFADMQSKAGVQAVFGDPIQLDGRTVIPVASVRYGFGMGGGTGPGKEKAAEAPSGGGGGGGMQIEPIALIEAVDGRIRVQPIINVTRLVAIGAFVAAWAIFWGTRTARVIASRR